MYEFFLQVIFWAFDVPKLSAHYITQLICTNINELHWFWQDKDWQDTKEKQHGIVIKVVVQDGDQIHIPTVPWVLAG